MFVIGAPAYAKDSWFSRACDQLLAVRPVDSPAIRRVQEELELEVRRNAKFSPHRYSVQTTRLEFLKDRTIGVEISVGLGSHHLPVRPINLKIFANPEAHALSWKDDDKGLARAPTLFLFFEDVSVNLEDGTTMTIEQLFKKEFELVLEKNPNMRAQMNSVFADQHRGLDFRPRYHNHKLIWVEGDLANFQVKRILLLALDKAYSQIVNDTRYAVKKAEKPPN